jgi:hypothetical protein
VFSKVSFGRLCLSSPKNDDPTRIVVLSEQRERRISLEKTNPPRPTELPAALISNAVSFVFRFTRSKSDVLQAV